MFGLTSPGISAHMNSCNFTVMFVGSIIPIPLSCTKVAGLQDFIEYETIEEGGTSDLVFLPKPQTQPNILTLTTYITNCMALTTTVTTGSEFPTIIIYISHKNIPRKLFMVNGCLITGISYSEFNSMRSEMATQTIEIAYNKLTTIPGM